MARHAGVPEVEVKVWATEEELTLRIRDAGIGFEPKIALAQLASAGLLGMRERAVLAGGRLTIESARGKGTTITAIFPIG